MRQPFLAPAGWDDFIFAASGIHPSGTDLYQHWGPRPATYRFDFIKKTPEYLAACEKALHTYEEPAMRKAMQDAVRKASEDSMVIPVYRSAQPYVMQPYVHTDWPKIHQIQWSSMGRLDGETLGRSITEGDFGKGWSVAAHNDPAATVRLAEIPAYSLRRRNASVPVRMRPATAERHMMSVMGKAVPSCR